MVNVAQLVEHQVVVLGVVGSKPTVHPKDVSNIFRISTFMQPLIFASFLIALGVSIAFNALFGINIPVIKLFIAGFLIYLGLSMLTGTFSKPLFSYAGRPSDHAYVNFFGEQTIDLSGNNQVADETIFATFFASSGTIKVNPAVPARIIVKNIASSVKIPRTMFNTHAKNSSLTMVYSSPSYNQHQEHLVIEIIAIFSSVRVIAE
jgi:hypothetical protein